MKKIIHKKNKKQDKETDYGVKHNILTHFKSRFENTPNIVPI